MVNVADYGITSAYLRNPVRKQVRKKPLEMWKQPGKGLYMKYFKTHSL